MAHARSEGRRGLMRQSNVIFAYLFAAFLIFITLRGELPLYMGLILGSGQSTPTPVPTATATPAASSVAPTTSSSTSALDTGFNILSKGAGLLSSFLALF